MSRHQLVTLSLACWLVGATCGWCLSGCGARQGDVLLHLVDLALGDCAEVARMHQGQDARTVEVVCNTASGVVRVAARAGHPADADGGAEGGEK